MPSLHLENSIVDDRYEVRRRLNHGSYAEIYEAFDLEHGRRHVIIKALNTALQGTPEEDLERTLVQNFQNEAVALDAVSHPNVVRRLGHGTAADLAGTPFHYLVLEFLPGGDLMALCRTRPLGLEQMLYYVHQVCEALEEAHRRGIIHRDIKPANLLLSADERTIKIADFGVAKLGDLDPGGEVTRVGTDLYAPPEHNPNATARGSRERLTSSADVYSLAKTIYTAMTGKAPRMFARGPITELPADLMREPWGPQLLEILRRATAELPADRYPSVRAFWEDLAALSGIEASDDADEHTQVRPNERLRHSAPLPPVAPAPDFKPQHNTGQRTAEAGAAPRIVVTLGGGERHIAPAPNPPAPPAPKPSAGAEPYSYREDLRDLIGSGWRLRIAVLCAVILLCLSAAAVYYEVHRYMLARALPTATVTTQLRFHDGPSPRSNELGQLPKGTRVRILQRATDGIWCEVEVVEWGGPVTDEETDRGWVNSRFLDVEGQ